MPPNTYNSQLRLAVVLTVCALLMACNEPVPPSVVTTARSALAAPGAPHEMKVLSLRYFPLNQAGLVDAAETGTRPDPDVPLDVMRARVSGMLQQTIDGLNAGSRYHGYKDANAAPSLHYSVVEDREILRPIPGSVQFFPTYDHMRMFSDATLGVADICHYVDVLGVKEVWVWGYHRVVKNADGTLDAGSLYPEESDMSPKRGGPFGSPGYRDISNNVTKADDLPRCQHTYVVFDFNYFRMPATLHTHGHQLENLLLYVDNALAMSFFNPWGASPPAVNACGDTHQPPNATADYQYGSSRQVLSNCEDWHSDGSGAVKTVDCSTWWPGGNCAAANQGDVERAQRVWWMQNMPGLNNALSYRGGPMFNWWDIVGDFDAYSGPVPVVTVSKTAQINDQGRLGGLVTIAADATSPFGINRVETSLGSLPKVTNAAPPFVATFDSTLLCNGLHPWFATAYDARTLVPLNTVAGGWVEISNLQNQTVSADMSFAITSAAPGTVFYSRTITLQLAVNGPHRCTQATKFYAALDSQFAQSERVGSGPVVLTNVSDGPQTLRIIDGYGFEVLTFQFSVDFDPDNDGFSTLVERYVGTDPYEACLRNGVPGWPPDFNNTSNVNALDQTMLTQRFQTKLGQAGYSPRFDLNADGIINSSDMSLLMKRYGKTCLSPL